MCLAIPAQVVELKADNMAEVQIADLNKEISLGLVPDVSVGDYVIVHVGFALCKLNQDEAEKTLQLYSDMLNEEV